MRLNHDTVDALAGLQVRHAACSGSTTRSPRCWRTHDRERGESPDEPCRLGPGPRRRRRGAVRGLSALPVPRQLAKEPVALAVRRAGPAGAAEAGIGEDDRCRRRCWSRPGADAVDPVVVRFLQLQHRGAERDAGGGGFEPVDELVRGSRSWLSWDEAVECEIAVRPVRRHELVLPRHFRSPSPAAPTSRTSTAAGWSAPAARCTAELEIVAPNPTTGCCGSRVDGAQYRRARRRQGRRHRHVADRHPRHRRGHRRRVRFAARTAGRGCARGGALPPAPLLPGARRADRATTSLAAGVADHPLRPPEIAEQSEGALYDSTEIDEILTLRVMTMTDEEKAQARATDPLAAQIIDRCDAMSPEAMLQSARRAARSAR